MTAVVPPAAARPDVAAPPPSSAAAGPAHDQASLWGYDPACPYSHPQYSWVEAADKQERSFWAAVAWVRAEGLATVTDASNDRKLELYALFKRITVGDANKLSPAELMDSGGSTEGGSRGSMPANVRDTDRAKISAWKKVSGDRAGAMRDYVELAQRLGYAHRPVSCHRWVRQNGNRSGSGNGDGGGGAGVSAGRRGGRSTPTPPSSPADLISQLGKMGEEHYNPAHASPLHPREDSRERRLGSLYYQ